MMGSYDSKIDIIGMAIVIEGNGAVLDAGGKGSLFQVLVPDGASGSLVLRNLILQNGFTNGDQGAALYVDSQGSNAPSYAVTIQSCIFQDHSVQSGSYAHGGAICFVSHGDLIIQDSTFKNNTASDGGAIYVYGYPSVTIDNTTFTGNQADFAGSGDVGGAITFRGDGANPGFSIGVVTIHESVFTANQAQFGSAIRIWSSSIAVDLKIYSSMFVRNVSPSNAGGALCADGPIHVMALNTTFDSNTGDGAAIFLDKNASVVAIGCQWKNSQGTEIGLRDSSNVTFVCPKGEVGENVTLKDPNDPGLHSPPPEALKCAAPAKKYLCDFTTHKCIQEASGSSLEECTADCSCVVPPNCGFHNDTTVCSHTFKGCNVCPTCCKSYIKNDKDCAGCEESECKNGHPECCRKRLGKWEWPFARRLKSH
jgi:predicted outer membrane repeat protein